MKQKHVKQTPVSFEELKRIFGIKTDKNYFLLSEAVQNKGIK